VCVPTRGTSKWVCVFPVKDVGSDTAGAARAAALVWGIGEGGMIWGWWGMGVSGWGVGVGECTGFYSRKLFTKNLVGPVTLAMENRFWPEASCSPFIISANRV
jgi:hypothetical protein